MRRELSTPRSWVYRWLIPAICTLTAVAVIVRYAGVLPGDTPQATGVFIAIVIAAALVGIARLFDRAKRVWLDGDALIVGWYGRETRIPVTEIERVDTLAFFWPHRVRLTFSRPRAFGAHAVFFPPLHFGRNHPVTEFLRNLLLT